MAGRTYHLDLIHTEAEDINMLRIVGADKFLCKHSTHSGCNSCRVSLNPLGLGLVDTYYVFHFRV